MIGEILHAQDHSIWVQSGRATGKSRALIQYCKTCIEKNKKYILFSSYSCDSAASFLRALTKELLFWGYEIESSSCDFIVVKNTDGGCSKIRAVGPMREVVGLKYQGERPSVLLIDNMDQYAAQLTTPNQLQKFRKWFFNHLFGAIKNDGIVRCVVGNAAILLGSSERLDGKLVSIH